MSSIERKKRKVSFTVIDNPIINDRDLKDSLGLLVYILSKPDNWKVRTTEIEDRFGMATKKRRRLFKELEAAGYAVYIQGGKGSGSTWVFSETKKRECQKETIGNQKARVPKGRCRQKGTVPKGHPIVSTDSLVSTNKKEEVSSEKNPTQILKTNFDYEKEAIQEICSKISSAQSFVKESWALKYSQNLRKAGTNPKEQIKECASKYIDRHFPNLEGVTLLNEVKGRSARVYRNYFANVWLPNVGRFNKTTTTTTGGNYKQLTV